MTHPIAAFALCCIALVAATTGNAAPTPAPTPAAEAQVIIVGTYHFENPGLDLHNVEAVDVMTPGRQAQLDAVVTALARFEPTRVAVEWPEALVDERYAAYRKGKLAPSRNEVVQLGFRLAALRKLERVHGIDVDGEFPFEAVQAWAAANGRGDALLALMQKGGEIVAWIGALQREKSIGGVLRAINAPDRVAEDQAFYAEMLRYGSGDAQPGAALNAAWAQRNYTICARLLQAIEPGDRVVVFYGAGHAHALQRCVIDTPGVALVDAARYLPE